MRLLALLLLAQTPTAEELLNRYLKGIEAGAARAVLENMQNFAPEDGRILCDLVVARGYKRGVEIGTARGNSAIWLGWPSGRTATG